MATIMSSHEPSMQHFDQPGRPSSIDLSIELERQLDNESLPPTPAPAKRPQSMDQHVLASIVRQLRTTVDGVTKERDELREQLSQLELVKAGTEDLLVRFSTRCMQVEGELAEAKIKMKDDEDSINLLRTKVEESRRGLMRLQTEHRRTTHASTLSVETSRPGLTGPSSNKRASFISLTSASINGQNRLSSVSDSTFLLPGLAVSDHGPVSPARNLPTDCPFDHSPSASTHPSVSSRRISGIFGRTSSPEVYDLPSKDPLTDEVEALRREMKAIKAELEDTKHELSEANEAREASETCANALRDFIAETQPTVSDSGPVRLPPIPTMTTGEEADTPKPASGWGAFRMWKVEPTGKSDPSESTFPGGTRSLWKVDTSDKSAPNGPASMYSSASSSRATPVAAPFAAKIGGFFSSRTSISSTSSSSNQPALQTVPPQPSYNGSDTSSIQESVVEPISPASEVPGVPVMVRGSSVCSSTDLGLPEHVKISQEPVAAAGGILPITRC